MVISGARARGTGDEHPGILCDEGFCREHIFLLATAVAGCSLYGAGSASTAFAYAEETQRGELGEKIASDTAVNHTEKLVYRTNHLSSTLFAVNEQGEIVLHMMYDAWGNPQVDTAFDINKSGVSNLNNYTGYTYDDMLSIYYAQARFYDADIKRFIQEDPIKDGMNWYAYTINNPLKYIDANGLFTDHAPLTVGQGKPTTPTTASLTSHTLTINGVTVSIGQPVKVNGIDAFNTNHLYMNSGIYRDIMNKSFVSEVMAYNEQMSLQQYVDLLNMTIPGFDTPEESAYFFSLVCNGTRHEVIQTPFTQQFVRNLAEKQFNAKGYLSDKDKAIVARMSTSYNTYEPEVTLYEQYLMLTDPFLSSEYIFDYRLDMIDLMNINTLRYADDALDRNALSIMLMYQAAQSGVYTQEHWNTVGFAYMMEGAARLLAGNKALSDVYQESFSRPTVSAPSSPSQGEKVVFGSDTKSAQKLSAQMQSRGWNEQRVRSTVDHSYTTRNSTNLATGNPATVYYNQNGAYVIIDNITKSVVQVSDNINPSTWIPDSNIVDPFMPWK